MGIVTTLLIAHISFLAYLNNYFIEFEIIVNLTSQHNSFHNFIGLKLETFHVKFWSVHVWMIKPCYEVSIINNFQRQSCSPIYSEKNYVKYFKIDVHLQILERFQYVLPLVYMTLGLLYTAASSYCIVGQRTTINLHCTVLLIVANSK